MAEDTQNRAVMISGKLSIHYYWNVAEVMPGSVTVSSEILWKIGLAAVTQKLQSCRASSGIFSIAEPLSKLPPGTLNSTKDTGKTKGFSHPGTLNSTKDTG